MKKGILVYTKEDAKINKWFISHLSDELKNFGAEIELFIYDGRGKLPENIDFCVNRSRFCCVNEELERKGIRCFNNAKTVKTANDKWLTYLLCREFEIPVMETRTIENGFAGEFPYVIKSRNGHGGSEVFLLEDEEQQKTLELKNPLGYIVQKMCSSPGTDVRVYTLGGKIRAAVKRTSKNDFRSNFSLGGKVELFTPTKEQTDMILKLQNALCTDYAGFDFILHNGKWVLNEIEDAVGARMLYSLVDFDIVKEYAKYISERI